MEHNVPWLRPTQVPKQLSFSDSFWGRVEPGRSSGLGWTVNWSGLGNFIPIASPGFQDAGVRFLMDCSMAKKGVGKF